MKKYFKFIFCYQEKNLNHFFKKIPFMQGEATGNILKKYKGHFLIILGLICLSLVSEFLPKLLKEKKEIQSLDSLIPKDFVLIPIEVINGKDIINIIGDYGVVDLYAYSEQTGLPQQQVGSVVKILPPNKEEGHFMAIIPEKQASYLFEYPDPFYAVIQNPNKKNSKIYKRKEKKSLIVIEENF